MITADKTEVKVGVAIEALWKALTTDFTSVAPLTIPGNYVQEVKLLAGNGGAGTVYLLILNHPDVPNISPQLEHIVDFDESIHQLAIKPIEGGRMTLGYKFYKTTYQLDAIGDTETLVNIKVEYELESQEIVDPEESLKLAIAFIECLGTFLNKQG